MIKVMIVDDEPIEREGLRLMLSKNRSNFEIVAEAPNGNKAVALAEEYAPDIVFMDIKMPEMDGVVAAKQILSALPNTKCIMVSAFNTFEYAQEVMKYGVKEYLLKPSKLKDMLLAYDRMVHEIEAEEQKVSEIVALNHRLSRIGSLVEVDFIMSLMMDHLHDFKLDDWNEWIDIKGKQGYVIVFSFESASRKDNREERTSCYQALKEILYSQHHDIIVGPVIGYQLSAFLLFDQEEAGGIEFQHAFVRSIIHEFQKKLTHVGLIAGVGRAVSDFTQFSRSYEEACKALDSVYTNSTASYMVYEPSSKDGKNEQIPLDIEKQLFAFIIQGDTRESLMTFETYFQLIYENSHHQLEVTKKNVEGFFMILTRKIKELGMEDDFQKSFHSLGTPLQVREASKAHLVFIMARLKEWGSYDANALLLEVKMYIDQHYELPITLEDIASVVSISSYYLSKLFKEKFHITIKDYVTKVRIDKAKEYLIDASIPLKKIAFDIGYRDPNYFSRVFKKETGLSPSEYRGKMNE